MQIYPLFSPTTLLDLLSQAEGLAEDAGNIAVVRRGEIAVHALGISSGAGFTREQLEGARTVTVDLKRLLTRGTPTSTWTFIREIASWCRTPASFML